MIISISPPVVSKGVAPRVSPVLLTAEIPSNKIQTPDISGSRKNVINISANVTKEKPTVPKKYKDPNHL